MVNLLHFFVYSKLINKTVKYYLEGWLAESEPFGPWGEEKFYQFIGTLITTKRKAISTDELKKELEKVVDRDDKNRIVDEALKRFESIYYFIKANSNLINCKFNRTYHNYIRYAQRSNNSKINST